MSTFATYSWEHAVDHCMIHIKRATELAEVIKVVRSVDVLNVVPIVSSIHATLLITPNDYERKDSVRSCCEELGKLVGNPTWSSIATGDLWTMRAMTKSGVQIDVATAIPNSKEDTFTL